MFCICCILYICSYNINGHHHIRKVITIRDYDNNGLIASKGLCPRAGYSGDNMDLYSERLLIHFVIQHSNVVGY